MQFGLSFRQCNINGRGAGIRCSETELLSDAVRMNSLNQQGSLLYQETDEFARNERRTLNSEAESKLVTRSKLSQTLYHEPKAQGFHEGEEPVDSWFFNKKSRQLHRDDMLPHVQPAQISEI